ncbi:DNA-binding protein [Pseudomonas tructae]|uniref:DNA-binding protein n=1 Tax=Pseudomonas tructae TaxID=2518644 RepID=A0A411MK30_9PSED|nr:KilA-N domain-containing protein [Pseudomonas tructae]QBF27149.1 DNA-binding protein [Pseudomonas tructae]
MTKTNNVIPFRYQGEAVRFNSDGWINATDVAKRFGKRPADWLKQDETRQYLGALAEALNCDPESLLETRRGRYHSGTWLHPKVAVAFARWLDLKFAVWCDLHIDALLRGELTEKQQFEQACKQLGDGQQLASLHGKGLADWRSRKPLLERNMEEARDRLQMVLGLDAA